MLVVENQKQILLPRQLKYNYRKETSMKDRVYNFYAGPGALPLPVLERVHSELFNYNNTGMSVMELSHRTDEIQHIIDDSAARINFPGGNSRALHPP